MKILTFTLVLLALCSSTFANKYILDKKDQLPPVGYIFESKSSFRMLSDTMTLTMPGEKLDGAMQSRMNGLEEIEILAPLKYRSLIKSETSEGNMVIGERINEIPEKKEVLLKTPVIWEKKNGKWTASPEKGEFTDEQKTELKEDIDKANKEASMYGYIPREIGEIWDVDLESLKTLLGDDKITKGTGKITFDGVKKYKGHQCAVLLVNLDVEGKTDDNQAVKMKGRVTVIRSLKFLQDFQAKGSIALSLGGEIQPGISLEMKGSITMQEDTTFKAPVKQ
jgi:hypothetical protein